MRSPPPGSPAPPKKYFAAESRRNSHSFPVPLDKSTDSDTPDNANQIKIEPEENKVDGELVVKNFLKKILPVKRTKFRLR